MLRASTTRKRKNPWTCGRRKRKKKIKIEKTNTTVKATLFSEKGAPINLDDNKKRWIVVGICLHAHLSPVLRRYVSSELDLLFERLKSSYNIDLQGYGGYLRKYPSSNIFSLNYEAINKNALNGKNIQRYDFKVRNPVDLSKLFLQTFMTSYTAFDNSCDASALLGIIVNVYDFPANVKLGAKDIRQNVRNSWAHCDFTEWDDCKYKHSIQMIENLIKQLGLSWTVENKILADMNQWKSVGVNYNLDTKLNLRIQGSCDLKTIFDMFPKLIDKEYKKNLKDVHGQMTELNDRLTVRLGTLEQQFERMKSELETYREQGEPKMKLATTGYEAMIENKLSLWEIENREFVPTGKSKKVYEICKNRNCVTVIGVPGAGKTSIIQHTALQLQKDGYRVIPVKCPEDIVEFYKQEMKVVYVINDLCGKFSAKSSEVEKWENALTDISAVLRDPCIKIIASCRLQVYNDVKLRDLHIFKSCPVDLGEDEFSKEETRCIARVYMSEYEVIEVERLIGNSNIEFDFFPLLCKMYRDYKRNGLSNMQQFFKNPFKLYEIHLEDLIDKGDTEDKCKYCVLALLVIFNNALEEHFIDHKEIVNDSMLNDLRSSCGLTSAFRYNLKTSINALQGTYIIKHGNIIQAVHDKMFDFLANYFGSKMLNCIIEHAKSAFISERFKWKHCSENEFAISIPDDYLKLYIKRMVSDCSQNKIFDVFGNRNMKDQFFRNTFLFHLKSLEKDCQNRLANKVAPNGFETPLLQSCFYDDENLVQWILNQNVDVNHCRANGATPLFIACDLGNTKVVKTLISAGASVNCNRNDNVTPLLIACMKGHLEIVKYLISQNTNVNKVSKNGESSLYIASHIGYITVAEELIKAGVNVNRCTCIGASPLFAACEQGRKEIVSMLLKQKTIDINRSMKTGMSPLFISCVIGDKHIVQDLLNHGANVNKCVNSHKQISTFFRNVKIMNETKYKNWWMEFVQDKGCFDLKTFGLTRGADDVFDIITGSSPLFVACFLGHKDVVELLLNSNAKVNKCKSDGTSPLKIAKQFKHTHIVSLLVDRGANIV